MTPGTDITTDTGFKLNGGCAPAGDVEPVGDVPASDCSPVTEFITGGVNVDSAADLRGSGDVKPTAAPTLSPDVDELTKVDLCVVGRSVRCDVSSRIEVQPNSDVKSPREVTSNRAVLSGEDVRPTESDVGMVITGDFCFSDVPSSRFVVKANDDDDAEEEESTKTSESVAVTALRNDVKAMVEVVC